MTARVLSIYFVVHVVVEPLGSVIRGCPVAHALLGVINCAKDTTQVGTWRMSRIEAVEICVEIALRGLKHMRRLAQAACESPKWIFDRRSIEAVIVWQRSRSCGHDRVGYPRVHQLEWFHYIHPPRQNFGNIAATASVEHRVWTRVTSPPATTQNDHWFGTDMMSSVGTLIAKGPVCTAIRGPTHNAQPTLLHNRRAHISPNRDKGVCSNARERRVVVVPLGVLERWCVVAAVDVRCDKRDRLPARARALSSS